MLCAPGPIAHLCQEEKALCGLGAQDGQYGAAKDVTQSISPTLALQATVTKADSLNGH